MKEFIRSQWTKAMRSLAAAEATLDTDPDSAASRAYYAAFHGVTATLAGRGMEFTKHAAVRAALIGISFSPVRSLRISVVITTSCSIFARPPTTAASPRRPSRVRRRRSRRHGRS
ncbi:MAG: HEPN domain-containing protein [Planctomycetota bacterium]